MATALVTGASSGIGREMARQLAAAGHDLVLVARSTEALEETAAPMRSATIISADLATSAGRQQVAEAVPEVGILVNNAGFGDCGPFATSDHDRALSMIEVNCAALTDLTGIYLPAMLSAGRGKILNIASIAAFQPGPTMAVYYATKAYVLSFTEAIAEEIRGSGVTATAFCPGAFSSGFQRAAHAENTRLIKGRSMPDSAQMASAALAALDRGAVVAVPGLTNKIGAASTRFTPRPVMRRIVHYIQGEV